MTRQRRPAGTSRKPAAAGSKRARSGAKNQPKVEDVQQEIDHKSIVRDTVSKMLGFLRKEARLPKDCHDSLFKIILFTPKFLEVLLRIALPKEVVDSTNFEIAPEYLDRVYDEWGEPKVEVDGAVVLTQYSGLKKLITLEHKSFYDVGTQFQAGYNTFRVWKRYFGKYCSGKAKLPETHALVVLHGPAADSPPPSMQELCGLADGDADSSFCASPVTLFDGRNATIEDFGPARYGGIVYAMFHSHLRPVCDAGVRYLVEAAVDSPHKKAMVAYILGWLDITKDRWYATRAAHPQAKHSEDIMGPLAMSFQPEALAKGRAEGLAKGRAKGLAEGRAKGRTEERAESVLKVLETRFGPVPDAVEKRIHAANDSELARLLGKAVVVPSVDALFNGYGGD